MTAKSQVGLFLKLQLNVSQVSSAVQSCLDPERVPVPFPVKVSFLTGAMSGEGLWLLQLKSDT